MGKLIIFWLLISITALYQLSGQGTAEYSAGNMEKEKGAFYTGKYRNLFREYGHSRREIRSRNEAAFQQLFHGDSVTHAVYFEPGRNENGPLVYVSDVLHNDVRSEGIS